MKAYLSHMLSALLVLSLTMLSACSDDNGSDTVEPAGQTVIMFYPWSTDLLSVVQQNVSDMSAAVASGDLHGQRVMVYMATSPTESCLYELRSAHGQCVYDTLRTYHGRTVTSRSGMGSLFREIASVAPACKYAMVVGGHALGWVPVSATRRAGAQRMHYAAAAPRTRMFGGKTAQYQIEVADFASALADARLHMEYILFDCCYMSTVEVAYDLRHVTDYMIACPTEILSSGFPYAACGRYMLGTVDYEGIITALYDHYASAPMPYVTAAVTDCRELDHLAAIARQISTSGAMADVSPRDVQQLDGYSPSLFLDLGDYMSKACTDESLAAQFAAQLSATVPYSCHTPYYYSELNGRNAITSYSGLTTSEPSRNAMAATYESTAWYKATH